MDPSHIFRLSDGRELHSLEGLSDALSDMSPSVFSHHVRDGHNDFATWIRDTCKQPSLAGAVATVGSQQGIKDIVDRFLKNKKHIYECIIVGAGIAGITAALYAKRKRLDFLFLSEDVGGQINVGSIVENYPGLPTTDIATFVGNLKQQLAEHGVSVIADRVKTIRKDNNEFTVVSKKRVYRSETVIIATGARARKLRVQGEEELTDKGVTYSTVSDSERFKDKVVAVVGGGNAALEAALYMLRIARHIYLINNVDELHGHECLLERVEGQPKITVLNNATVKRIHGSSSITSIDYRHRREKGTLDVEGVFVEIGRVPNTEMVTKIVDLDKHNHVKVDKHQKSSVNGLFAAGDCANGHNFQYIVAAGQGATALLEAVKYLHKNRC